MIDVIVRGSIWLSLVSFVAAQFGFRSAHGPAGRRALVVYGAGAVLLAVHIAAVFAWHHDWSHARAVEATARETSRVFGLDWGGGVWVNYAFLAAWIADALRRTRGRVTAGQPVGTAGWAVRAAAFVVIVNGAIVFVPWPRNLIGVAIVLALVVAWRPGRASLPVDDH